MKPGQDDKVIAGWNALMVSALARAAEGLGDEAYLVRACQAADFVLQRLTLGDRLLRSFRGRASPVQGYLEDYAYWVAALIDLYEATLERRYLEPPAAGWTRPSIFFTTQTRPASTLCLGTRRS